MVGYLSDIQATKVRFLLQDCGVPGLESGQAHILKDVGANPIPAICPRWCNLVAQRIVAPSVRVQIPLSALMKDEYGYNICDNCEHPISDHLLGRFEDDPWMPMCSHCTCIGNRYFND